MLKGENTNKNNFFESVYLLVRQIPYGKVSTYGAIAAHLGSKSSARMVGWAMNASHNINESIPAHRVVNRKGMLSGKLHFTHPKMMEQLLKNEGIVVKNDNILHFEAHFWNDFI